MKKHSELVAIWECVSDIPGWLRLLWLSKQYTDNELDELERIDDVFLSMARRSEIKHKQAMRDELPHSMRGWLEIFPEAQNLVTQLSKDEEEFSVQLRVARKADLVSVVEQYINLKRSGAYCLIGLCPFHEERTPSFTVYTNDNHYYCFGCHAHGDAISFIGKLEELTFKQSVRVLYQHSMTE